MQQISLRSFRFKARHNKRRFRRFLTVLERNAPRKLRVATLAADKAVWQEVDCLSCANCCKTMSPTYTATDIKRIASHLQMSPQEFKDKWLVFEKTDGDWINKSLPCQFLDLSTNKCGIYDVRPADCAGFPHHTKRKMIDYMHVYKQNVEHCPAIFRMVERMMEWAEQGTH